MSTSDSLAGYYQARATEYEAIYAKPERQDDLGQLKMWLSNHSQGRTILEIACGTGYWSAVAANGANRIIATDVNEAPLEIARAKGLGDHVEFSQANAYQLPAFDTQFDCGMAHFWWSHLRVAEQGPFVEYVSTKLSAGASILMIDNNYVDGSNTPISKIDSEGNTYQKRSLANGETFEIVKNFPAPEQIEAALAPQFQDLEILELEYFWAVRGVSKRA